MACHACRLWLAPVVLVLGDCVLGTSFFCLASASASTGANRWHLELKRSSGHMQAACGAATGHDHHHHRDHDTTHCPPKDVLPSFFVCAWLLLFPLLLQDEGNKDQQLDFKYLFKHNSWAF